MREATTREGVAREATARESAGIDDPRPGDRDEGEAFVVKADLDGPVMSDKPIHLDGMALRMRELREGEASIGTPFPALARRGGVFQASAGFFAAPLLHRVVFTTHGTVRGLRFDGLSDDRLIVAEGAERRVGQMNVRLRSQLPRHATVEGATAIYWQCRGDPEALLRLLRRVECVGGRRNACYGTVLEWSALPCGGDVDPRRAGLLGEGRVLRNLPRGWVDGIPEGARPDVGRVEPSYGAREGRVEVVTPTLRGLSGSHADARALFGF